MTSLSPRGLQGQVIRNLGLRIVKGEFQLGDRPVREAELQEEFGTSRSVVREAVKALTAKGLVESRQNSGIRVRPRYEWNLFDPDVLAWQFEPPVDSHAVLDLVVLRRMIEPTAAGLAAQHATAQEAELLMNAVAAMRASADRLANFNDADIAFHVALFDATHNAYLARLGRAISSALLGSFRISANDPGRALAAADKHQFVAEAIAQGDAEAATLRMSALIDQAATDLAVVLQSPRAGQ